MVNVQTACRVKTFAWSPDFKRSLGIIDSPIDKQSILRLEDSREIDRRILVCRHNIPRSLVTHKMGRQKRVRFNHRRSQRTEKPTAFALVTLVKTHQHGIRPENHLRKHLVAPRALEPDNLGTRSHERLPVGLVSRVRIKPDFRLGAEKRGYLRLSALRPRDAIVVIVVVIVCIGARLEFEIFPVLEIRNRLARPGIDIPVIALALHHRPGISAKTRIVVRHATDNMRSIARSSRIPTEWRLQVNRQIRPCRDCQKQCGDKSQTTVFH